MGLVKKVARKETRSGDARTKRQTSEGGVKKSIFYKYSTNIYKSLRLPCVFMK
jgi:hypothetical protein